MVYADATYYKDNWHGTVIPDEELDKYLMRASLKVDIATYNRTQDFERLSEYEQNKVRQAVCAEAEAVYEYGENETNIASYSIGDVSVSMGTGTSEVLTSAIAVQYLNLTNLTCRII